MSSLPDTAAVVEALPDEIAVRLRNGHWLATLDHVSNLGFWLVVGLLALLEAAIVVTALRMRVRPIGPRSIVGRRSAEIGWTTLPALLLVALVVLSL